jgi:hypothetical protein
MKAKKTAGTEWAAESHFFCKAPRANSLNDPLLEPAKIFDNVDILGRIGTAIYAITTSAGIMLIDSGFRESVPPFDRAFQGGNQEGQGGCGAAKSSAL